MQFLCEPCLLAWFFFTVLFFFFFFAFFFAFFLTFLKNIFNSEHSFVAGGSVEYYGKGIQRMIKKYVNRIERCD